MKIHESGEMYLETILLLSRKMQYVRSLDIATDLGFSKPSVSRAVGLLKKAELIVVDSKGYITLTDEGKKIAERMYERHTVLTSFLEKMGVSHDTASQDACKIEHHISEESFNAIKNYVNAFRTEDM
jgi:Mn-dependent DtxR family transcriptional regulator